MAHLGIDGHSGDALGDRSLPVGDADELLPLEGEEPEAPPLPLWSTAVSGAPRGEQALRLSVDLVEARSTGRRFGFLHGRGLRGGQGLLRHLPRLSGCPSGALWAAVLRRLRSLARLGG